MIAPRPLPPVIVSSPPTDGSIDSTRPTVSGRLPNRSAAALEAAAMTWPLSPTMMFVPEPPTMTSPAAPPITIALPTPIVIVSTPPSA